MKNKTTAIILAGGEGHRAGGDIPKQFRVICGHPMVWWSMKAFHDCDPDTELVVVLHPGYFDEWDSMWEGLLEDERFPHRLCCGGRSRTESVANGLIQVDAVGGNLVAVHDAARPLIDVRLIERCWNTAAVHGTAVPSVPVTDSLRMLDAGGGSHAVDRSLYVAVQTPQTFDAALLKRAYSARTPEGTYTDDASVVEAMGVDVTLCEGDAANMKVTNPADFVVAEALLDARYKR